MAFLAEIAQLVERWLPKPKVASSSLVFRSLKKKTKYGIPYFVFFLTHKLLIFKLL